MQIIKVYIALEVKLVWQLRMICEFNLESPFCINVTLLRQQLLLDSISPFVCAVKMLYAFL